MILVHTWTTKMLKTLKQGNICYTWITFARKLSLFLIYYRRLINWYTNTIHDILEKEIKLLLPQVQRKKKCGIITTLVSSFIGLAFEGISSFLHQKCNNALHKAVTAMNDKANIQHNQLRKLENSVLMYGVYNAETLEKLINTVHDIYNTTSSHERLFAGWTQPFYILESLCTFFRLTSLLHKLNFIFENYTR